MNIFKKLFQKKQEPPSELKKLCIESREKIIEKGVLILKEECIKHIERNAKKGFYTCSLPIYNVFINKDDYSDYLPFFNKIGRIACKELQEEYKDILFRFQIGERHTYINMAIL